MRIFDIPLSFFWLLLDENGNIIASEQVEDVKRLKR